MRRLLLTALLLFVYAPAFANEAADINLKLKSKDVFVFKNGIDLVLKSGKVENFNGTAVTDDFPDTLLGSIITYVDDRDAKINSVTAYKESVEVESEIDCTDDLLEGNIGKKVKVRHNDETVSGTLKIVNCDFIIVKETDENIFIKRQDIKSLSILEEIETKKESTKEEARLKFDIETKKSELLITLGYLRKGIRWIPLYKIELLPGGKALITLDAQIVNDGEDVDDANIFLVVGAPNFKFSDTDNPFALKSLASQAITGAVRSNYDRFSNLDMSNSLMTQSLAGGNVVSRARSDSVDGDSEWAGGENEDTFVYQLKYMNLKKGGRMIVNLFSAEIKYEDIYKLDMVDKFTSADGRVYYSSMSSNDLRETESKVWHNLRLLNTTAFPWTTGVATVFKENSPIAQDMLRYTPKGTDCDLPLMVSSDILVTESGRETKREKGKGHFYWSEYYDKVTVEADIKISNAKEKDVKFEVTKSFYGDESFAENGGEVTKSPLHLVRVNPLTEIKWSFDLGRKKDIKLDYGFSTWAKR